MTYVEMILFVSLKAFCCILELFQAKKKITFKCPVIFFFSVAICLLSFYKIYFLVSLSTYVIKKPHFYAILQYRDCYTNDDQFKMSDVLI